MWNSTEREFLGGEKQRKGVEFEYRVKKKERLRH